MTPEIRKQSFLEIVWRITRTIPAGRVVSYQVLAQALGSPRLARAVGNALNKNPYRSVPCHRVVRSDGRVGGYARGTREKIKVLRREGVKISGERVGPPYILKVI